MSDTNKILNANDANLWFDGEVLATLTKASAKVTKDTEDLKFVGDKTTHKRSKGYKVEGSFTINKINDNIAKKVSDAIKNGKELDSTIIGKQGRYDGKTERVAVYGVDIAELTLFDFEAQSVSSQEFPFTAVDYEYLDTIDD